MPRYVILRTFSKGLDFPGNVVGASECLGEVNNNLMDEVTRVHSYVTKDKNKTFCIYDAPSPDAIRKAAEKYGLPVNKITEICVLNPYFYN